MYLDNKVDDDDDDGNNSSRSRGKIDLKIIVPCHDT